MTSSRPELRLDWCGHKAAEYAVKRWHYSKKMPACKRASLGVWEDGKFIGAVIFGTGSGASTNGKRFGLRENFDVAELVRVALTEHQAAVSKILSIACRMLRKQSPGLRLLISYADPAEGHTGGIYQASGWVYIGRSSKDFFAIDKNGRKWHSRTCSASGVKMQYGKRAKVLALSEAIEIVRTEGKHTYLMPLDDEVRASVLLLAKPYPKRAKQATATDPAAGGGAAPTRTLQAFEA